MAACPYCGFDHGEVICPRISAVEYNEDGTFKRVEFVSLPALPPLQAVFPRPK